MITICTTSPHTQLYRETAAFAREVYQKQLGATLAGKPDLFSCARHGGKIIGCFGLYQATQNKPLLIEQYIPQAFSLLAKVPAVKRSACAELGTRAVVKLPGVNSFHISTALVAALLIDARAQGITWVAFTSNRRVKAITDTLGLSLTELGPPCLDGLDEAFKENWANFFRIEPRCYGFAIDSTEGCQGALNALQTHNIARTRLTVDA